MVSTYHRHAYRCDSGGERFLLSFRGPSKPATSVADLGGGVYGFAYASAVSGPYVMSLTLHGVHLPGSPFTTTLGEPRAASPLRPQLSPRPGSLDGWASSPHGHY